MLTTFRAGQGPTQIQSMMGMARMLSGSGDLSIASLRALSPFEENAQKVIDTAVVKVGLNRLVIASDIIAEGLVYRLSDPLSVMEIQWEQVNKVGGAQRTMTPSARGENQLPNRRPKRIPVYLTTDDFSIGIRTFKMGERIGQPLDTFLVEEATRRVNEAIEDATINGVGFTVDGYPAFGLLNAPNVNTLSLSANWGLTATTGDKFYSDVQAMIAKLQADGKYGPYGLYTGTGYGNALDADFKANGSLTIRQRLMQIDNIKYIKTADQMPANTVVMFQLTSDVVDMVVGQAPTVIPWTSPDGFTLFWMVMAILIPRVKDDYDGNSGICVATFP